MSPRGIADLLIYNENGNRPQRIRGQSAKRLGATADENRS
jgi:hypothetical protein